MDPGAPWLIFGMGSHPSDMFEARLPLPVELDRQRKTWGRFFRHSRRFSCSLICAPGGDFSQSFVYDRLLAYAEKVTEVYDYVSIDEV